jgi:hypothetical protein
VAGVGTIVSKGDLWFDYLLGIDIIDCLRSNHGLMNDNFAKAGDMLKNMVCGTGINRQFQRVRPTIERVLPRLQALQSKALFFLAEAMT